MNDIAPQASLSFDASNGARLFAVADIVFREDLYPRTEGTIATNVQAFAEDLSVLPPIEVNQDRILIDGWHRWTAHKKAGAAEIPAIVTRTTSEIHLKELACERNAAGVRQMTQGEKRDNAREFYNSTPQAEREAKKARLAQILKVSERTIREWLSRIDKDAKAALRKQAFDMWLAMHTQAEIAAAIGYSQQAVAKFIEESGLTTNGGSAVYGETPDSDEGDDEDSNSLGRHKLTKEQLAHAEHAVDFQAPIYNVWKQQEKSKGASHHGNSEIRWVDNLLYLYTKPFDVIVDPFAGSGSTIDLCKRRLRRYWVSDRAPVVEREKDIRKLDVVTDGLPALHKRWSDVRLVYLDPPYWKQAEGQYSQDASDFGNMTLEEFTAQLAGLIKEFGKKLSDGARVALILQPTQWNAPERAFTDHIGDMLRLVKMPVEMRISVPYESQQHNAQMVEWAAENRRLLVLTREIVVWRIS